MTKKLVWRLANRPTPMEVVDLLKETIITKEEAREILFTQEDEKTADKKALESEIKFLRELVDKLSSSERIREITYQVLPSYQKWPWYQPYHLWCGTNGVAYSFTTTGTAGAGMTNAIFNSQSGTGSASTGGMTGLAMGGNSTSASTQDFKDIKTF